MIAVLAPILLWVGIVFMAAGAIAATLGVGLGLLSAIGRPAQGDQGETSMLLLIGGAAALVLGVAVYLQFGGTLIIGSFRLGPN